MAGPDGIVRMEEIASDAFSPHLNYLVFAAEIYLKFS